MRIAYPKSFLKLLLLGFLLIMLPLVFAFSNAMIHLDRLADKSRSTVAQAVQATRTSRVLVEQLSLMERSARQYFVLQDTLLLENYTLAHEKFLTAIRQLLALPLSQDQQHAIRQLSERETKVYQDLMAQQPESEQPQDVVEQFVALSEQAQQILAENNRLIDRESASLAETADRTQKMMLKQTLILLPVALLVAGIITFLVARPIRRMDAAIRRLGEGKYNEPISIDGPGDIRTLGERLDWLRAQLLELDQQQQRFLRHVSHELKTPLTAIREGSELLGDEVGGPLSPQQKEITGILRENTLRLQRMIENLLSYTAIKFKKPELKLGNVNLMQLLEKIITSYALTLSNKEIKIVREFENVAVFGDEEKIHTIIDNLFSNAIKYSPPSGSITLRIRQVASYAVIEVRDEGPGISAGDKARIFDPFYRGDGVYESLVSGSGLGLSIVKEYTEAHGGEISLLPSRSGAHFRIRLPLKVDAGKTTEITNAD